MKAPHESQPAAPDNSGRRWLLAAGVGAAAGIAQRAAELERRADLLAAAAEAVRTAESGARALKEADARLADAAFRAGFDTPEAAAAALLTIAERRELQHGIDAWQREAAVVAEGTGTGVPESVPDAYQQAAEASAAIRGGADPDG